MPLVISGMRFCEVTAISATSRLGLLSFFLTASTTAFDSSTEKPIGLFGPSR